MKNHFSVLSWVLLHLGNLSTIMNNLVKNLFGWPGDFDKIHIRGDCIDWSVINSVRQSLFFSFVSNKPPRNKVFCEPETQHFRKTKKSALNDISFYSEDDNQSEVNFIVKTSIFTLHLFKPQTKFHFRSSK